MILSRTMVHWRSRESDNILKGYKLDIQVIHIIIIIVLVIVTVIIVIAIAIMILFQTMIGSKAPPSILNWVFKYMHCRKVFSMLTYIYIHRSISCNGFAAHALQKVVFEHFLHLFGIHVVFMFSSWWYLQRGLCLFILRAFKQTNWNVNQIGAGM